MKFAYYYDLEKTHVVEYDLKKESLAQLTDGRLALSLEASIEERVGDKVLKREEKTKTFLFLPDDLDIDKHDLTVSRIFIAEQGKWILEVRNRQNENDTLTIGILSDTKGEPVLLEVNHEDEYRATSQANLLSRIASEYNPPLIAQTRFEYTFDGPGLPQEMTSKTATYDGQRQAVKLSDVKVSMPALTVIGAQFETSMQVLPETLVPAPGTDRIFVVVLDTIGTVEILSDKMRFTPDALGSQPVEHLWGAPLSKDKLESYYVHPQANFYVRGDGVSELLIGWYGEEIKTTYDPRTQRPGGIRLECGKKVRL